MERLFIQIDMYDGSPSKDHVDQAMKFALDNFDNLDPNGAPKTLEIEGGNIHVTMNKS